MIIESIIAATIIAIFAENARHGARVGLASAPLRYLGRISYSFYLLHPLSLLVICYIPRYLGATVDAGVSPSVLTVVLFAASILAVIPIAHLQYALVERGGIEVGRRLLSAPLLKRRSAATQEG